MLKKSLLLGLALFTLSASYAEKKNTVVASTIQLPEQEIIYNDGIELLNIGHYDDAITKFTAALSIDSTFANAYYNRAVANIYQNKLTKALADLDNADRLITGASSADIHILRSKILYSMGDIPGAGAEIDKALETDPNNVNALLDKAAFLQATEQYEEAVVAYTSYNYKTGGNASALNELGNCCYLLDGKRAAYECYKKAYMADSTNRTVCFNLAKTTWEAYQDTAKALEIVDNLIDKDLTNAEYYNLKGYICYQAGDTASASLNFDIAIRNNKNMAQSYMGRGLLKMQSGDYYNAIADFNNAISANMNYGDAYLNRGIAKEELEDYAGACEDFHKAAGLGAANAKEYYTKQCD